MKTINKLKILYQLGFDARYPKIFSFHDCLPDVFSGYLELLVARRYRILGSQELLERLVSGHKFKKEVLLTFDDGRRNCWTVIYPLLKKYKIRASIFIIPSRISDSQEVYPNLQDYWNGKVSWENLYITHRRQPYLSWRECAIMQASGFVDIYSHSMFHQVVPVASRVIDFQHPGVYEMPVYFDEWFQDGQPQPESTWGWPVYERRWGPLASNQYYPDPQVAFSMNAFVRKNGDFLFFKKKGWRKKLIEYFTAHQSSWEQGHYRKLENQEEAKESIGGSKKKIEECLKHPCLFFSLPLYQSSPALLNLIEAEGYKVVLTGLEKESSVRSKIFHLKRIPSFWIKFLQYF